MATAAVVPLDSNPVAAEKLPKPWVPVHPIPPSRDMSQNSTAYLPSPSGQYQFPLAPATPELGGTRASSNLGGERKNDPGVRKLRKQSRSSLQLESRRSISAPHIVGEVVNEAATISSPGDKRKNKLGYQRTSMACGHCRRRKIRCIPPTDEDPDADPQGRCANCIRLKKECIFFPVDHATDTRSGRRDVGSVSASSASSPRTPVPPGSGPGPVPVVESQRMSQFEHHRGSESSLSLPGNAALSSPYLHGTLSADHSPLPYQAGFPLSRPEENPEWTPSDFGSPPHLPPPYWTSAESTPNRPNFSPNPLSSMGASPNPQFASPPLAYQQGNQAWPPSRSSSFGQIEGVPSNYPYSDVQTSSEMRNNIGYPMGNQPASASHSNLAETSVHPGQLMTAMGHVMPNNIHFQQPWMQQGQHGGHVWLGGSSGTNLDGNNLSRDQYSDLSQNFYPHTTSPG